jgi:hypothetical protein
MKRAKDESDERAPGYKKHACLSLNATRTARLSSQTVALMNEALALVEGSDFSSLLEKSKPSTSAIAAAKVERDAVLAPGHGGSPSATSAASVSLPVTLIAADDVITVRLRTYLDASEAAIIFRSKHGVHAQSTKDLAQQYNLSTKAVRDIWNMRTWVKVTAPYWSPVERYMWLRKLCCPSCISTGAHASTPLNHVESTACTECKHKATELSRMCETPV